MLLHALTMVSVGLRRRIARCLVEAPVRVTDGAAGVAVLAGGGVDLLLVERARLRGSLAGALQRLRDAGRAPELIVFTEQEDPEQRAAWLAEGVLAVLNRGLSEQALREALQAVIARAHTGRVVLLRRARKEPRVTFDDWDSDDAVTKQTIVLAMRAADSDATVLLTGETGVGKERLARAMHEAGARAAGPFVAVNCGALSEQLLESELFGHVQGAFTGALHAHRGLFELAHGGTLLLDEVGDMPSVLQVKLLRVLQDRSIRPVGAEQDIPVDVRVIAATNRDLQVEQQAGRFRSDLYYRIAVVTLRLPPLRERPVDVPPLVRHHLERLARRAGRPAPEVEPEAMALLRRYRWPGNVRELVNVLERALLLGDGLQVRVADLPLPAAASPAAKDGYAVDVGLSFAAAEAQVLERFSRDYLTALLRETRGHLGEVARRSGLSARAVYGKLQRLGIDKLTFRRGAVEADAGTGAVDPLA